MPKMLLPDVNVWLALAFDGHAHHRSARNWFDGLTAEVCGFCRLSQQGFLRLACNPSVFGKHALTLAGAWQAYDLFLSDPRVDYADEPPGIEQHWRSMTRGATFSPHVWNDAYLAAFASVGQMALVTFDQALSTLHPGETTLLM